MERSGCAISGRHGVLSTFWAKSLPGCIFCPEHHGQSDEQRLILYRGDLVMVMMNRFPYNNGHLLVSPWRHISSLDELTADEERDLMGWIKRSTLALKKVMRPDGFNIGLNIGREAGAGYEEHLHFHIVPRWRGDTNFMAVLAESAVFLNTYSKHTPDCCHTSERRALMRLFKLIVTLVILCLIAIFIYQNMQTWTQPVGFKLNLYFNNMRHRNSNYI